mgnify:CR=1 FL=1
MAKGDIRVDGRIASIRFRDTRKGKRFAQVLVRSSERSIQVDIFDRRKVAELHGAHIGDRMTASGPGFHRGRIRSGTTSITASRVSIKKDVEARERHRPAEQMSLFAT